MKGASPWLATPAQERVYAAILGTGKALPLSHAITSGTLTFLLRSHASCCCPIKSDSIPLILFAPASLLDNEAAPSSRRNYDILSSVMKAGNDIVSIVARKKNQTWRIQRPINIAMNLMKTMTVVSSLLQRQPIQTNTTWFSGNKANRLPINTATFILVKKIGFTIHSP